MLMWEPKLTLILGSSATNKRRMEEETILRRVTTSLQSTEKGLLSSQNLDSWGWVLQKMLQLKYESNIQLGKYLLAYLCKFCQRTSVGNQSSADNITDKWGEGRCNRVHLVAQIVLQFLSVISQRNDLCLISQNTARTSDSKKVHPNVYEFSWKREYCFERAYRVRMTETLSN